MRAASAEALYLFAACWLLAQVEIQIEGPHGWAERLPYFSAALVGLIGVIVTLRGLLATGLI